MVAHSARLDKERGCLAPDGPSGRARAAAPAPIGHARRRLAALPDRLTELRLTRARASANSAHRAHRLDNGEDADCADRAPERQARTHPANHLSFSLLQVNGPPEASTAYWHSARPRLVDAETASARSPHDARTSSTRRHGALAPNASDSSCQPDGDGNAFQVLRSRYGSQIASVTGPIPRNRRGS